MKGGVTALLVVDDPFAPDEAEDEFLLLVGTTHGEVYISDILSKKSLGLVHRKFLVIAVGVLEDWKFTLYNNT